MSQITSHILDTSLGIPAQGVKIVFSRIVDGSLEDIGAAVTNADGRVASFDGEQLGSGGSLEQGVYQLRFLLDPYFKETQRNSFYPEATVTFRVAGDGQHYHVPLLVNPFGYSTYRGS